MEDERILKNLVVPLIVVSILFMDFTPSVAMASHRSGYSSTIRTSIRELDGDRVENVPVPVLFGLTPDNIYPSFGDPRPGGRTHEGIDIMAPRGAPVVTPTQAVVVRMGQGDTSGNYVYTANPGGEIFAYMHLDKFADIDEGDELNKGDLIGYVGTTGNAIGTPPHLHFEIRDGDALDPYPRIRSIFPLADKIKYLARMLESEDAIGAEVLAGFVAQNYRRELTLAQTYFIALPPLIIFKMQTLPAVSTSSGYTLNPGDLTVGSRGTAVTALQNFLIMKNIGSGGSLVPDGVFGLATQKALAEYQLAKNISPANGYYGPITRAYIAAHP